LNAGTAEILPHVTTNTLAVMPVHMFGLPMDIDKLNAELAGKGTYVIEDAASAMGAKFENRDIATRSDIGIYSFNRGKNLSTFTGGAVLCNREEIVADIQREISAYPNPNLKYGLKIRAFAVALSMVVHPLGYSLLHPIASKFKYTSLHTDFHTWTYTDFQARLGLRLIHKLDEFTKQRLHNAQLLTDQLRKIEGVKLPTILPNSQPAFNQYPVLFSDEKTREKVHNAIVETGLEATLLYPDPIHRLYKDIWDGQGKDPFPNATTIAKRLMLIPVHPLVPQKALQEATDVIAKTLK